MFYAIIRGTRIISISERPGVHGLFGNDEEIAVDLDFINTDIRQYAYDANTKKVTRLPEADITALLAQHATNRAEEARIINNLRIQGLILAAESYQATYNEDLSTVIADLKTGLEIKADEN